MKGINAIKSILAEQGYKVVKAQKTKVLSELKKAENTEKSLKFFEQKCKTKGTIKGNIVLPTKAGNKTYPAVEFDNGKVGVVLNSGYIKYAWN